MSPREDVPGSPWGSGKKIPRPRRIPAVMGNAAVLTQCLANLIDNGLKFSKPGMLPHVEIWAETQGARARIHIKDQGIGIAPAFQQKIFEMFYQQDARSSGTGVGLEVAGWARAADRRVSISKGEI